MGFEKGKRTGKNWEDVLFIDSLVKNADKKSKKKKILNFAFQLYWMLTKKN